VAGHLAWPPAAQPNRLWREALAGLALTLALTKPQDSLLPMAILVLWLWRQRRRTALASLAGWLAALSALSTLILPGWWEAVDLPALVANLSSQVQASGQVAARVNAAFPYWAAGLGLSGPVMFALYALLFLGCLGWLWQAWQRYGARAKQPSLLSSPAYLVGIATVSDFLLTPYAFEYDYIVMLPALLWALQSLGCQETWRRWLSAALLVPFYSIHLWGRWMSDAYWLPIFLACLLLLQGGSFWHEGDFTAGV